MLSRLLLGFSDEFEDESIRYQERLNNNSKLKTQYAQLSSSVKKEGGALVKAVKSKVHPFSRFEFPTFLLQRSKCTFSCKFF